MFKRTLRFVTENSNELATVDPFYLPQIALSLLQEHTSRFIAVYDPENNMKTIFIAHYNIAGDTIHSRYTYCFFDGSANEHLKQY